MQLSIDDFARIIPKCRSRETSGDPKNRSDKNPSYRQCLVTALLANEFLGLDVYTEKVTLESGFHGGHYFNKDKQNISYYFCEDQFTYDKVASRTGERNLSTESVYDLKNGYLEDIQQRYEILKQKFQEEIGILFR